MKTAFHRYFFQNNSIKLVFSAFEQNFTKLTRCVPLLCLRIKPQVMNQVLIVIAFLIVPFFASAQNDTKIETTDVKIDVKADIIIKAEINQLLTIKKVDPISINPKKQNLDLNFKKSSDIISVKAYIKSLQLKRKATVMS